MMINIMIYNIYLIELYQEFFLYPYSVLKYNTNTII